MRQFSISSRLLSVVAPFVLVLVGLALASGTPQSEPQQSEDSENQTDSYIQITSDTPELAEPPENLQIKFAYEEGSPVGLFSWDLPTFGKYSGFHIRLRPIYNNEDLNNANFNQKTNFGSEEETFFSDEPGFSTGSVFPLEAGQTYSLSVVTEYQGQLSQQLEANFTLRPNPPARFVVWYRNETSFLVLWQPPSSGVFDRYKTEISPRDSPESTLFVSQYEYQFGGVRPGFFNLTPGKAYNISVVTESDDLQSEELVKEYRTMPLRPENVSVAVMEYQNSILVEWIPPEEDTGEYDGFNVYIKQQWGRPMQKFVSRSKPPKAHLEDPGLQVGEMYEVVVKTVSGKVSSVPASANFTFVPKSFL